MNDCPWRLLPNAGLSDETCKHPWAPWGVGMRCQYLDDKDQCPTWKYGQDEEEEKPDPPPKRRKLGFGQEGSRAKGN